MNALFSKNSCTNVFIIKVINLKKIVDGQIQDYVIHNKHLNTMHLIKTTIMTPQVSHCSLCSPHRQTWQFKIAQTTFE
jgi:hypothetical protein